MIRYAVYNEQGHILSYGEGRPPTTGVWLEHDIAGSLDNHYVDVAAGALAPKRPMALTRPGPTPADGVTDAVIAGLPRGCVCEFTLDGQAHRLVVTDGTLEIALDAPVTLRVTFWHPSYRHDPIQVEFV